MKLSFLSVLYYVFEDDFFLNEQCPNGINDSHIKIIANFHSKKEKKNKLCETNIHFLDELLRV